MTPPDHTVTLAPRDSASSLVASRADVADRDLPVDDPDRYEQLGEHARGGIGRVTRARDRRLGRTVAVKELIRRDAIHEARFVREALITARLDHPGIVAVHEAGRWPSGEPYYVMKLVSGSTMHERLAQARTPRERLALLPHVIAVADAVGYAHSEGVIHRDLKPANVVIGEFGETVVVDWGLAFDRMSVLPPLADDDHAATGIVGTPAYMAPELVAGDSRGPDERGDVYAIGAIIYELLAGAPPYCADPSDPGATSATPRSILARACSGPPRLLATGPRELVAIARTAMARDPAARYADARALAAALRQFQAGAAARGMRYRGAPMALAALSAITVVALGFASHARLDRSAPPAQHAPGDDLAAAPALDAMPTPIAPAVRAMPALPAPMATTVIIESTPDPQPQAQPQHRAQQHRVVERESSCDGDRS
jgi:tRNA A-37 threonylcarbamoyl transferase component Bud32|nr:serine/threonine-protein kinase [Kofleriaceae bacterium]